MAFFTTENSRLNNADKAWSYSNAGGVTRFEVRADDYYQSANAGPGQDDISLGKNRSEQASYRSMQPGREFTVEFDFQVEAGQPNTADWLVLAQLHQTEDTAPDGSLLDGTASPPVVLGMRGEKLVIINRTDPDAILVNEPPATDLWLDSANLVRGSWHTVRMEVVFDHEAGGNGVLNVWIDGVQVVGYTGPTGYNDVVGPYLSIGVYREQADETTAAQFRNVNVAGAGLPPPMNGTSGDDNILANKLGFWEDEVLNGYGGNDTLDGGFGADTMYGGAGDDVYVVNDLGDVVSERSGGVDQGGTDLVRSYVTRTIAEDIENLILWADANIDGTGNALNNTVQGNTGNNILRGQGGNDSVLGDRGDDRVYGGTGDDQVYGSEGNDTVYGDENNDKVYGEAGNDRLYGGTGNDTLEGGAGDDTMEGGAGNDEYVVEDAADVVIEVAGGGNDTVRASVSFDNGALGQVEVINSVDQTSTTALNFSGSDLANEIRGNNGANQLIGRGGNDLIQGNDGHDRLQGDAGNDSLFGGAGDDTLTGGDDNDSLQGEAGADNLQGDAGNDTLFGGAGDDTLIGGIGNDSLQGEAGADNLQGDAGDDTLFGGDDNDTLTGGSGNDVLSGGAGNDSLDGGDGDDRLDGGLGADTMRGGAGNDQYVVDHVNDRVIEGIGGGSDTVRASASFDADVAGEIEVINAADLSSTAAINLSGDNTANEIRGNNGANRLDGRGGNDLIIAYAGADTLIGGDGNDSLQAGDGNDRLEGGAGNDTLRGDAGADSLYGGDGDDLLYTADGDGGLADGGAGNDVYYVDAANTTIIEAAGGGADTIRASVSITLDATDEVEVILASDGAATTALNFIGSDSANELRGNAGANTLDGRGGADNMFGYGGNDIYHVDNAGDRVNETAGNGTDTVRSSVNFTIGSTQSIEVLQAADRASTSALILGGNDEANTIRGNLGANLIQARGGNDTIDGAGGNDTVQGGAGTDTVIFDIASTEMGVVTGGSSVLVTLASGTTTVSNDVERFQFTNGVLSYAQVAALNGQMLTQVSTDITGTANADTLTGTAIGEVLRGLAGNDSLRGEGGDDTIYGGAGNDTAFGGAGADTFVFELANSAITVASATGGVSVTSAEGVDFIASDIESIQFTDGTLSYAQLAARVPVAGDGLMLTGNDAGNLLQGTDRADLITANGGNDWINPGLGSDTIDGGDGVDMASFIDHPGAVIVSLRDGTVRSGADTNQIRNVENITGTIQGDFIRGDAADNNLRGMGGYDWFVSTDGADTYDGSNGRDMISYIEATAAVTVDLGQQKGLAGQAASHTYVQIERVTGSIYADSFYGSTDSDDFRGAGGEDLFYDSLGRDRYDGGASNDTVIYALSATGVNASLLLGRGGPQNDLYTSIENLIGSNRDDVLTGDHGRNALRGSHGADRLMGLGGNDVLEGGTGDDVMVGGDGYDVALYRNAASQYTVRTVGDVTTVTHASDGTDTITEVEALRFTDGFIFL